MLNPGMILLTVFALVCLVLLTYIFVYIPRMKAETEEGFIVPFGAGVPACTRSLPELADIIETIERAGVSSDASRELVVLCGKLACAKTDLLSTAGLIQASANQPFATTHDLQPIQETLNQCFNKAIPERDLDLVFDMYRRRGDELIGEICGGASTLDVASMHLKFKKACNDVYNIAKQVCLSGSVGKRADILPGLPGPDMAMYILGGAAL